MLLFLYLLQLFVLQSLYNSEVRSRHFLRPLTLRSTQLTTVYKLQKCSLGLLCLLSVLCVRISSLQAQEDQINKCYSYFEEILEIQGERRKFRVGVEYILELATQGKVDKKTLAMTVAWWHTVESSLKSEVTSLYDTAYAEGCFDESLGTKTRNAP